MKWIALAIMLSAGIASVNWVRHNPKQLPKLGILVGCLPVLLAPFHLYMAAVSWSEWPGYVKGLEISTLDILVLVVYIVLPRTNYVLPFRLSMILYFVASILSVLQSGVPMASVFYCWQLIRVYVVYYVVAKACAVPKFATNVLIGSAIGIFYEAVTAGWEHFVLGQVQAAGAELGQNTLGMISHLAAFPFFALLLMGRTGWLPVAVVFASILVEVSTTSRATVALAGFGYLGLFLVSAILQWTSRKATILLIGSAVAIAAAPVVIFSFEKRFSAEQTAGLDQNFDERAAFEQAASMMLADHPLGIGANQYVIVANTQGYNQRAGVPPLGRELGANVHNVYMLVAAESGWLGLLSFLLLLSRGVIVAILCGWRNHRDPRGALLLGLGVGLLIFVIHCKYEWVFVTFELQYLYAISLGLVAGISQQLGYWAKKGALRRQTVRTAWS